MVWQQCVAVDEEEKESVSQLEEGKFYSRGNVDELNAFLAQVTGKDNPKVMSALNLSYKGRNFF